MPVNNLIQIRKGSFSEWSSTNPVLGNGEPGFDTSHGILKIGDGVNSWSSLTPLTSNIVLYVKNTTGSTVTKGQVVYINGAQGDNPTIELAIADGETSSSKTLGLLQQNLLNNEFGYVIVEGLLEGIDTNSATAAGDPIWLSPTVNGGVVYGSGNKPSAPNHMVFIGYVLRKQSNNGKVYIKVQNGFELQELHNVAISGVSDNQVIKYDSITSLWKNQNLSVADLSDFTENVQDIVGSGLLVAGSGIILNYNDSANTLTISSSGTGGGGVSITNFSDNRILTSDGTSTGINAESNLTFDGTSLKVNNIDVSVSGHNHTSSDISNFNSSVSGLLPVTNITAGSGISVSSSSGNFTVNSLTILSYATTANFPVSGSTTSYYLASDTSRLYQWTGSLYVEIGPPVAAANNAQNAANLYLWSNFR